jgi:hypothetical protein
MDKLLNRVIGGAIGLGTLASLAGTSLYVGMLQLHLNAQYFPFVYNNTNTINKPCNKHHSLARCKFKEQSIFSPLCYLCIDFHFE